MDIIEGPAPLDPGARTYSDGWEFQQHVKAAIQLGFEIEAKGYWVDVVEHTTPEGELIDRVYKFDLTIKLP